MRKSLIGFVTIFIFFSSLQLISQVNQEWVRRFTDTSSAQWDATSIKMDSLGFIYVLAESGNDFGFLKYSPAGNLLFAASYWPGGFDNGHGNYFDVTPQGNVYITGGVGINLYTWIYTVKYNSSGVFQWGKLYNPDNIDEVYGIRIDKAGNVIVIGGSQSYGLTIKYSPNGDTLWTRYANIVVQWGTLNRYLAIDDTDNIYIAGSTSLGHGRSIILKYNTSGNLLWNTTFAIDTSRSNLPRGISLDIFGNIYAIGTQSVTGAGTHDYLLKLGNGGNIIWNSVINEINGGTVGQPIGPAITLDGNSIYYSTSLGINNSSAIAIVKYNSIGDTQWTRLYNEGGAPYGIRIDSYQNDLTPIL